MHYDKLYTASYKYIKLFYIITSIAFLFGQAKRASRERASEGRGAFPPAPRGFARSLVRYCETRFTRPNRRACLQAISSINF